MDEITPDALYDPTPDERSFATLSHALQMVLWFVGPLAFMIAKWDSKFVRFHAVQALLLQACTMLVFALVFVGMFAMMFATFPAQPVQPAQPQASQTPCDQAQSTQPPPCNNDASQGVSGDSHRRPAQPEPFPTTFFIFFPLIWLGYMGWFILMVVLIVIYSIKAGRGEWKGYPLLGRLSARMLGIQLPR